MPARQPGMPRPDLRDPFVLSVHELARRPGTLRRARVTAPAPDGLRLPLIGIPAGSLVDLDLRLEAVEEGVLVSGPVRVRTRGECGRCLEPFDGQAQAAVQELFFYPERVADEPAEDDEDRQVVVDDHVDIGQAVRDAVLTSLPLTPLCRPDCRGLCPQCGERLDSLPPDHRHETSDPRWQALAGFSPDHAPDEEN